MQRQLLLTAAVIFGAFGVTALVFRQTGVSQETLSLVGGIAAYLFLAAAAVLLLRAWRVKGRDPVEEALIYVRQNPRVAAAVGQPLHVGEPEGELPVAAGASQARLDVVVSGPDGLGRVDLELARLGRRWEVRTATLTSEGERVALQGGAVDPA